MANNRLYLYDPETNERFMLAKADDAAWYIRHPETFVQRLEDWFELRDMEAAYGGTESTSLLLLAEGDLPENAVQKDRMFDKPTKKEFLAVLIFAVVVSVATAIITANALYPCVEKSFTCF